MAREIHRTRRIGQRRRQLQHRLYVIEADEPALARLSQGPVHDPPANSQRERHEANGIDFRSSHP